MKSQLRTADPDRSRELICWDLGFWISLGFGIWDLAHEPTRETSGVSEASVEPGGPAPPGPGRDLEVRPRVRPPALPHRLRARQPRRDERDRQLRRLPDTVPALALRH